MYKYIYILIEHSKNYNVFIQLEIYNEIQRKKLFPQLRTKI